jgi:hypothetical protein
MHLPGACARFHQEGIAMRPPLIPQKNSTFSFLSAAADSADGSRAVSTRDHQEIRRWAECHHAQPATGEATRSGPPTIDLNDGGAGIRFNFPGVYAFRPIAWDEWLEHFDQHRLIFVYEEDVEHRAYELWEARGRGDGRDWDDWFEAERQLHELPGPARARYRIVSSDSEP